MLRRQPRQQRGQEKVNRILAAAQTLFVTQGYAATTTNAIAAAAEVPIGSLYQFFPDKAAILKSLAIDNVAQMHDHLMTLLNDSALIDLPLSDYVNLLVDATQQFFVDHPVYYAIYIEVQGMVPEIDAVEQIGDLRLIQDLGTAIGCRNPALTVEDMFAIGFVVVKATGNLLWLSFNQEKPLDHRLMVEAKRMTLHYLQSYNL